MTTFVDKSTSLISSGDFSNLREYLETEEESCVRDGSDLIPLLAKELSHNEHAAENLEYIVEKCSGKESLINFQEIIEEGSIHQAASLLPFLAQSLRKIERKQDLFLSSALESVISVLQTHNEENSDDELQVQDIQEQVDISTGLQPEYFSEAFTKFTLQILEWIKNSDSFNTEQRNTCKEVFTGFLLRSLTYTEVSSKLQIARMVSRLYQLHEAENFIEFDVRCTKGLAIYLYQSIIVDWKSVPPYSMDFLAMLLLRHVHVLGGYENDDGNDMLLKCLEFTVSIESALNYQLTHRGKKINTTKKETGCVKTIKTLCEIMTWSDNNGQRHRAKALFDLCLSQSVYAFDSFSIVKIIFDGTSHDSLNAYLIQTVKDILMKHDQTLVSQDGKLLEDTVNWTCGIASQTVTTQDLLRQVEQTSAVLNIWRFVFLQSSSSLIKSHAQSVSMLLKRLNDISSSAKEECARILDVMRACDPPSEWCKGMPSDHFLFGVPDEEQEATLGVAMCRMDLLASLVDRVREIVTEKSL